MNAYFEASERRVMVPVLLVLAIACSLLARD